jgi:6,7-dimethyl-8-ribityllumazine synthase
MKNPIHILVVEGRFYHHISDHLILGAEMTLREQGATWEVVMVPGALEIPQVLSMAIEAGLYSENAPAPFHGFVALGCVIRGETSHYEIVAGESARALIALATTHAIPFGNGILTVENEAQAIARASADGKNKGRDAVEACLDVIRVKREFAKRSQTVKL